MYKDKEELNEISKKITPALKKISNKFIDDLLEIGVNLNTVEDILVYLDFKFRYIGDNESISIEFDIGNLITDEMTVETFVEDIGNKIYNSWLEKGLKL